jgi:hypothetical protein
MSEEKNSWEMTHRRVQVEYNTQTPIHMHIYNKSPRRKRKDYFQIIILSTIANEKYKE